jgi:hypothetical protein
MNWGPQIEVWAKLEKELGLTKPKSGADILERMADRIPGFPWTKPGFRSAAQVEFVVMIGGLDPVTKTARSGSFRKFCS